MILLLHNHSCCLDIYVDLTLSSRVDGGPENEAHVIGARERETRGDCSQGLAVDLKEKEKTTRRRERDTQHTHRVWHFAKPNSQEEMAKLVGPAGPAPGETPMPMQDEP